LLWSGAVLWAWLDLNQRPHPYQGSAPDPVCAGSHLRPARTTYRWRPLRTARLRWGVDQTWTRPATLSGLVGLDQVPWSGVTGPARPGPRSLRPTRRPSLLSPRAHLDQSATGAGESTLDAPLLDDHVSAHHGPAARTEGFEPAASVLQQPWSWPRMTPELRLVLPVVTARVQPEPAVPDAVRTQHGPAPPRPSGRRSIRSPTPPALGHKGPDRPSRRWVFTIVSAIDRPPGGRSHRARDRTVDLWSRA
jgi:hypothetical protein